MEDRDPRYAPARTEHSAEHGRLQKLESVNDPATLRRLDAIGVSKGWRCVEVGAGAGSIARALAERVGTSGLVVAADMDPRFLDDFPGPARAVLTHDITHGPVPPADFDFAHCRAVLAHVADMSGAVRNLMASVRPGGILLSEEPDYGAAEPCDPNHPRADVFARYIEDSLHYDRMDAFAGRHAFSAFVDAGLEDIETEAVSAIVRGGSPRARYRKHTMENSRQGAIASGAYTEASFQALIDCFEDPSFHYVDPLWVGTTGRVPA